MELGVANAYVYAFRFHLLYFHLVNVINCALCWSSEQETIPGHKMPRSVLLSLFQRLAATVPKNSETFAFSREDLMERLKAILTKTLTRRVFTKLFLSVFSCQTRFFPVFQLGHIHRLQARRCPHSAGTGYIVPILPRVPRRQRCVLAH